MTTALETKTQLRPTITKTGPRTITLGAMPTVTNTVPWGTPLTQLPPVWGLTPLPQMQQMPQMPFAPPVPVGLPMTGTDVGATINEITNYTGQYGMQAINPRAAFQRSERRPPYTPPRIVTPTLPQPPPLSTLTGIPPGINGMLQMPAIPQIPRLGVITELPPLPGVPGINPNQGGLGLTTGPVTYATRPLTPPPAVPKGPLPEYLRAPVSPPPGDQKYPTQVRPRVFPTTLLQNATAPEAKGMITLNNLPPLPQIPGIPQIAPFPIFPGQQTPGPQKNLILASPRS